MGPIGRVQSLQAMIRAHGLSGAVLFYSRDVLYYTGTAQPSYLVLLPEDYFLFVRSGFEFALGEAFIDEAKIREERRLENIYREIFSNLESKKIATELDIMPAAQYLAFKEVFACYDLVNASPLVLEQRKRKDPLEIKSIEKACQAIDAGHRAVLSNLKEGITELELAAAVENAHRLAGHEGIFFIRQPDFFMSRGPLCSGVNLFKMSGVVYTITGVGLSPSVPAGPSRKKIREGEAIIVDIPTLVDGYHADQTRTYTLGKANAKIKAMYRALKEIADYLIETITPGMKSSEIYRMAIERSIALKVNDAFLSFGKGKKSQLLGHGIGLELNEPPVLSQYDDSRISEGQVIALDMHMLDEEVGVVKLEDMILIKPDGNEILTKSPRGLIEVG
jgi:Xaa-Pro dipeptidase